MPARGDEPSKKLYVLKKVLAFVANPEKRKELTAKG